MKLIIKNKEVDYISDYPEGWHFLSYDPFKTPVSIGEYRCFIKRFQTKKPTDIPGWELLVNIKGKEVSNLPQVFETKEVVETEKKITYVFYEHLEGQTLEQAIAELGNINLQKITDDLFSAMRSVHENGFWFSDFCERNIFWEKSGRFLLVDLDSAQPASVFPSNDLYGSKDYWIPVYKFYKEGLLQSQIMLSHLNGISLNYLQCVFFILRLKLFQVNGQQIYKSDVVFDSLPAVLGSYCPGFEGVFRQVLEKGSEPVTGETIAGIRQIIHDQIINNNMKMTSGPKAGALIHQFTASSNAVTKGEPFTLSWEVEDADKIELYRNGVQFQIVGAAQNSLERTEFYDSDKDVTYQLFASKDGIQSKSRPLVIKLKTASTSEGMDPAVARHLHVIAPWAKFIAITGLVILGLSIIWAIAYMTDSRNRVQGIEFLILLFLLVLFIPMWFMLRFSNHLKNALDDSHSKSLVASFHNLKLYFLYIGFVTIIFLIICMVLIFQNLDNLT